VAIVGGNVETSQRIVDLVLTALGTRAASAGSMSNLVIGGQRTNGDHWSFYETLGGGYGATPTRAGTSARQTHMTNTRATDPEVLARRLPLRVVRFAIRPDSGGHGLHRGGDGLLRELEVSAPCIASLLAAWRPAGAPGLCGGQAGAPGRAFVRRRSLASWSPWDGEPTPLEPGDRIRVETPGGGGWGTPIEPLPSPSSNLTIKVKP
jgi:5-oxoprolinase (ATP-hydrolysing)